MANLLLSQLKDGKKIDLSNNTLQIDGVSAFDVGLAEKKGDILLTAGGKTLVLTNWTLDQLSTTVVSCSDNSDLILGDNLVANANDVNAQTIVSSAPAAKHNDQMRGLGGDDTLSGGAGNDRLFGNDGDDTINGDADNDIIDGGKGTDTIDAGAGDDRVEIDQSKCGSDIVQGGEGKDKLLYDMATLTTTLTLDGGAGNDRVVGGNGNDTLRGSANSDQIVGNNGDDLIIGGTHNDKLTGGAGVDTFRVGTGEAGAAPPLCDTITDFITKTDFLDLVVAGTAANYREDSITTDNFSDAIARARDLMQGDSARVLVFIAGLNDGWVFGDLDVKDQVPDTAIFLEHKGSLDNFRFQDII